MPRQPSQERATWEHAYRLAVGMRWSRNRRRDAKRLLKTLKAALEATRHG